MCRTCPELLALQMAISSWLRFLCVKPLSARHSHLPGVVEDKGWIILLALTFVGIWNAVWEPQRVPIITGIIGPGII